MGLPELGAGRQILVTGIAGHTVIAVKTPGEGVPGRRLSFRIDLSRQREEFLPLGIEDGLQTHRAFGKLGADRFSHVGRVRRRNAGRFLDVDGLASGVGVGDDLFDELDRGGRHSAIGLPGLRARNRPRSPGGPPA